MPQEHVIMARGGCATTARALLFNAFGPKPNTIRLTVVPGRVNLIGEHIDYHLLPVLPMAIDRATYLAYRQNDCAAIRAVTDKGGAMAQISLVPQDPDPPGSWTNYIKAAVHALHSRWALKVGIDAAVSADLPVAAGLSSSSALLTAFAIALLRANAFTPRWDDLMQALPEGEQFVGTRGGSMDHAAVLGGRVGCALYLQFDPLILDPVPVPDSWAFVIADSLQPAEKSGAVRERYNRLRLAGFAALQKRGFRSFKEAVARDTGPSHDPVYSHVLSEASRVESARRALEADNLEGFGELMLASHASLRHCLHVSTPALDRLVDVAMNSGAAGARLTGAGFGGCILAACKREALPKVQAGLRRHYANVPHFNPDQHVFEVRPSHGALHA